MVGRSHSVALLCALILSACWLSGCSVGDCSRTDAMSSDLDSGGGTGTVITGVRQPWDDIVVRYAGSRELDPADGTMELLWEIDHPMLTPPDRLTATAIFGTLQTADIVEVRIERESTRTTARVTASPPRGLAPGSLLTTTIGLRLSTRRGGEISFWDIPPRTVDMVVPGGTAERGFTADGRLEISLHVAPDVPLMADAWVMKVGRTYQVLYRVYNRTSGPLSARVRARAFLSEDLDTTYLIGSREFVEFPLDVTPTAVGPCGYGREACHTVTVQVEGEAQFSDGMLHAIQVIE